MRAVARDLDDVLGPLVGLRQSHLDLALDVLALPGPRSRSRRPAEETVGVGEATVRGLTEEGPEEVRETARVIAERTLARLPRVHILEAAGPGGTSAPSRELLPIGSDRVVPLALLGIAEDLVGLIDLLELLFRVRFLVHVRVVLARELSVGLLDVVGRGVLRNAQRLVVVLVFDRHRLRPRKLVRWCRRRRDGRARRRRGGVLGGWPPPVRGCAWRGP